MNKVFLVIGRALIVIAISFIFIHSFVVIQSPDESFKKDLFGLVIPEPPLWTSYIPYLGFLIGVVFEFFSVHGIVGISIFAVLMWLGGRIR